MFRVCQPSFSRLDDPWNPLHTVDDLRKWPVCRSTIYIVHIIQIAKMYNAVYAKTRTQQSLRINNTRRHNHDKRRIYIMVYDGDKQQWPVFVETRYRPFVRRTIYVVNERSLIKFDMKIVEKYYFFNIFSVVLNYFYPRSQNVNIGTILSFYLTISTYQSPTIFRMNLQNLQNLHFPSIVRRFVWHFVFSCRYYIHDKYVIY